MVQSVSHPKLQGGLGFKNLGLPNKSLLMKWLWRYGAEEPGLWKEVIIAKIGHWCAKNSRLSHGVGLWKHMSELNNEFFDKVTFTVGNGRHIKFWRDKWLGNSSLMDDDPSLFQLVQNSESTIAQNRHDSCSFYEQTRDRMGWEDSKARIFSVKE